MSSTDIEDIKDFKSYHVNHKVINSDIINKENLKVLKYFTNKSYKNDLSIYKEKKRNKRRRNLIEYRKNILDEKNKNYIDEIIF